MKDVEAFINSGIIEVYCMGAATEAEQQEVNAMAALHAEVRDEMKAVYQALETYALGSSTSPLEHIRDKILDAIEREQHFSFPPRMNLHTRIEEWQKYMADNAIDSPSNYDLFYLLNLPGNETQYTYIAWARKGAVLEETHGEEDEYLLMMKGQCSVTINGKEENYQEGDLIFIPKGALHRAEALSEEPMVMIGQRTFL